MDREGIKQNGCDIPNSFVVLVRKVLDIRRERTEDSEESARMGDLAESRLETPVKNR